jgi:phthiodiolone/phenolphthiodiolone dimycocerosates ketoreductase
LPGEPLSIGVGIPPRPPASLLDATAEAARSAGADTLWCIDHFSSFIPRGVWDETFSPLAVPGSNPDEMFEFQTLLGYAAARAGDLRLGVGVTEAVRRHPLVLAQSFLTLSHLTDSKVILGIGAGERENIDPVGLAFDSPVGRLDEALQILHTAFETREPFDFDGQHFTLRKALTALPPGAGGKPDIWVAAMGPRMLRLAGRYADGWYPTGLTDPADYAARLAIIRESATRNGRNPLDVTPGLQVFAVADEDRDQARSRLDEKPVRLMSLLLPGHEWSAVGARHPLGTDFGGLVDFVPQHLSASQAAAALDAVPGSVLEKTVLWGTPDDIVSRVGALAKAGLRHLVLHDVPTLIGHPPGHAASRFALIRAIKDTVRT